MRLQTIQIDPLSKFILVCLVLSSMFFMNGSYMFACLATFGILFYYIQQPYKPAVFTLILAQHILQVIASVWLANYLERDITFRSSEGDTAIYASLAGISFMFIPIIYFQSKMPNLTLETMRRTVAGISTDKVMYCYIAAFFVANGLSSIAFLFSGLTQIIVSLLKIKWFFFLLFGFVCILKQEKKGIFYLFVVLEFVSGLFSYFSEFKNVIYFLVVLLLTFVNSINFKQLLITGIIGFVLVSFALFWTTIKTEYRNFLNEGAKAQVISVSREDALNKLYNLSSSVSNERINSSTVDFLDRLQYTYNFSKAIERVPDRIPFQDGANWLSNIEFVTTPRFLNPDKPSLDNSVKASKYTGLQYSGAKKGVSFSLGYFAEFYVDFGIKGMMVALFFFGLVFAFIYDYLMKNVSDNLIVNYAAVGSFFMEFYAYEMDGTYLSGRLFASLLTYFILIKFFFPPILSFIRLSKARGQNEIPVVSLA